MECIVWVLRWDRKGEKSQWVDDVGLPTKCPWNAKAYLEKGHAEAAAALLGVEGIYLPYRRMILEGGEG